MNEQQIIDGMNAARFNIKAWKAESARRRRVRQGLRRFVKCNGILVTKTTRQDLPWAAQLGNQVVYGPGDLTVARMLAAELRISGCP